MFVHCSDINIPLGGILQFRIRSPSILLLNAYPDLGAVLLPFLGKPESF